MVKPGDYDPAQLQSNRLSHQASVFPIPAKDFQSISFTLDNDGMVQVEILSPDGKVLKSIHNGKLPKGKHQLETDVRDIPATVFFYRISDGRATSLVKAMKVE